MSYKVEISGHVYDTTSYSGHPDGSYIDVSYATNIDLAGTGQIYPNMDQTPWHAAGGNPLQKLSNKLYPSFTDPPKAHPTDWSWDGTKGYQPEPEYLGWKVGYWKPPPSCCIPNYYANASSVQSVTCPPSDLPPSPTDCINAPWDGTDYPRVPYKQNLLLVPGEYYDIRLTVINPLGDRNKTISFCTPAGSPGGVQNLKIKNIDSSTVDISWNAPAHSGARCTGDAITGYDIYWYQQQNCYTSSTDCKEGSVFPEESHLMPYDGSVSLPCSYFGSPCPTLNLSYTLRDLSCGYYYRIVVDASNSVKGGCGGEGIREASCVQMGINPPQPDFSFIQSPYSQGYPDWQIGPWTISCGHIDISFTQPYDISSCINQIRLWESNALFPSHLPGCSLPPADPPPKCYGPQPHALCWKRSDCSKVDFETIPSHAAYGKPHIWRNAFVGDPSTYHFITLQSAMHNRWCNDGNCIPFPNTSVCNCSTGMNDLSSQTWDYSFCVLLDGSSSPPRGDLNHDNKISIASLDASTIDISWNKPVYNGGQDICGYVVVLTHNAAKSYLPDENPYYTAAGTHPKNFWNAMGDLSYPTNYRTSDDDYRFVTHYPYMGYNQSHINEANCPGFVPIQWESELGQYPYGLSYNYIPVADSHNIGDFSYNLTAHHLQCAASYRVDIYAQNDTACSNAGDEDLANFPYCYTNGQREKNNLLSDYNTPNFPIDPAEDILAPSPLVPNEKNE